MPFPIAQATHFRLTAPTLAIFPTILFMHVPWLNPLPTTTSRTVNAVLSRELLEFAVPVLLEVDVKEFLDVLKRDMVSGAAFRWHVLGIVD